MQPVGPGYCLDLPELAREHAAGAISALGLGFGFVDPRGLAFDFLNPSDRPCSGTCAASDDGRCCWRRGGVAVGAERSFTFNPPADAAI